MRAISLPEFYQDSPYAAFPQEHRSGGSLPVGFIKAEQQGHDFVDAPFPQLQIIVGLKSNTPFRWNLGDGWTQPQQLVTGNVGFVPAYTEIAYEIAKPHTILMAAIPEAGLRSLLADAERAVDLNTLEPLYTPALRDQTVRSAVLTMWAESARGDAASTLMIDGLMLTAVGQLLRLAGNAPDPRPATLCARTLARLDDYIEAQHSGSLTIAELARVAGLSKFQFARAFKATTGLSPHRYVLERRVRRVRELLADPALSLAEIAYACGFASQSHMTDVFRHHVGIPPGRYRAQLKR